MGGEDVRSWQGSRTRQHSTAPQVLQSSNNIGRTTSNAPSFRVDSGLVLFLHVFQIFPEAPVAPACHPQFCQGADTAEQAGPDIWRRYSVAKGRVAAHVKFTALFVPMRFVRRNRTTPFRESWR